MKGISLLAAAALIALVPGLAAAQTFSNAFAGFGDNDKEPIQIEAQELQVEDKTTSATVTGDVLVSQGETRMKTQKLRVFYDGKADGGVQQRIMRLEANGRVYISSKDQTATGDEASFDMARKIMVMTGQQVVLSQGPNVVVGNKLTINLETGKADLEAPKSGRVKVLIQPNSLNGKGTGN